MAAYICVAPFAANAQESVKPSLNTEQLRKLGERFMKTVAPRLEEADLMIEGGNELKLAELRSGNIIPEGELLILRTLIGRGKLRGRNDILALKQDEKLMISLGELAGAVNFALRVLPEQETADGWFYREDQTFQLDAATRTATINGVTEKIPPDLIMSDGSDIMIESDLLKRWLKIDFRLDLNNLVLFIYSATDQKLPAEEREDRNKRPLYAARDRDPQLPLKNEPARLVTTKPYFDVSLNADTRRADSEAETRSRLAWNVTGAGDLLGFTSQTFIRGSMDNSDGQNYLVSGLRQTFSKDDPDGQILGDTGIKRVSFGDITGVAVPIAGGSGSGQGVRISNNLSDGRTTQGTLDVEGNAQPGWDVELYRNDSLVGLQQVSEDGRYIFPSVFLFAGNNTLRLVFYGPQGQQIEEIRNVFSEAGGGQPGNWDIAVAAANLLTYQAEPTDRPSDGELEFSGKYERGLGALGSGRFGFTSYVVDAGPNAFERKNFVQAGLSTELKEAILTADVAMDDAGAHSALLAARRNFGRHQTGLTYRMNSADFSTGPSSATPANQATQAFFSGPLGGAFLGAFRTPRYAASALYASSETGDNNIRLTGSLSASVGKTSFSTGLNYNVSQSSTGNITPGEDRLSGSLAAGGGAFGGRWRLTSSYDVQPLEIQALSAEYDYPIARNLRLRTELRHALETNLTTFEASTNWQAEKFSLSPRLTVDNEGQLTAGANMRFGLAADPYTGNYGMYRTAVANVGGVAARVFFDANGDGIYNEGDELIEGAEIKSLQGSKRALTNAEGVAFIPKLSRGRRTDIELGKYSLPDPFYMSMEDGYSLLPRPGITSSIDYPVVVVGEIDGRAEYDLGKDLRRPARNLSISLVTPWGAVQANPLSEHDGYFYASEIRPGTYYLSVSTSEGMTPGYALPQLVSFDAKGTTIYGRGITLKEGYNIPFSFRATNQPPGARRTRVTRPEDIARQETRILLGDYRSRIGLAVAWYKFRLRTAPFNQMFELAMPLSDIQEDPKTARLQLPLVPHRSMSIEQAARTCEKLIDIGFVCGVEIVTTYKDVAPPPVEEASKDDATGKT